MKKLLFLTLLISQFSWAQKISIKGVLRDTSNAPLASATILLLNPKDSSLVNFGASNAEGSFEIKNLNRQEYIFKVTFVGFAPLTRQINPAASESVVELGVLKMEPETHQLKEIAVQSTRAPVTIKKDTIEFNALAFKTQENAMVEDLLKKLPGVEVDNDGTIRAQGEQVKRVTVDGKDFFGSDPKVATRNLPANAIDKVQVYDKKSDQAVFSGIDDGQREKTINLELKEEKRNGAFGNLVAGAGTDDRYQAKTSINRFKKGQQLSFLGMANNINDQGFGIDEYMNFTGSSQQMAGGGPVRIQVSSGSNNQGSVPLNLGGRTNGIMETYAGGLNFNKTLNKKTELTSSYFYNHLDHDLAQALERINYFSTGNLKFNQQSRQLNTNENHRVNTTVEHKIDSMNSMKWITSATYNETDANEISNSENLAADESLLNESIRNTSSSGTSLTLNSNLLWRHRFAKKGRTFSANLQFGLTDSDREGQQDATNTYYNDGEEIQNILQTNTQVTNNYSYATTLSYTEPLGKRRYLEVNYNFRQNNNEVDRKVYDVDSGEPVFNTTLSNQYASDYQYHRAGLNLRINKPSYSVTVGSSIQQTYLDGELKLTNTTISKAYQNFLPVARFNYDFTNTKHLHLDYETSVQEPTIQQLQPVVDNSDPLNLTVGNPNLRPAYAHNWRLNFMTFDPMTFINFFAFVDASYTRNAIVTAQQYDEQQIRTSMPVNVDNNIRLSSNATFGFPIQKINSRFSISANITRQDGTNVIDDIESNIAQNTLGGRFRYDYHYKEIFDVNLSANLSRQSTDYEFNTQADQLYFNNTYIAEATLSFLKNYQFNSALEYLTYKNKTNDYEQAIPLLNLSVSRFVLKGKSGELKFSVNNLLDKNIGVSQTADVNYFQRQTSNSLGRYFMLSFTYALNKQLNPTSMRPPGGGMMRIMHGPN